MKARVAMTRDVVCVTPDASLASAYEIMTEWEIRHLPVLDGKTLVGILSDRDVLVRAEVGDAGGITVGAFDVGEAMTPMPITCMPSSTIAEIGETMLDHKIDALPVLDDEGELVGLVTSSDLIQMLISKEQVAVSKPLPFRYSVYQSVRPGMAASARL